MEKDLQFLNKATEDDLIHLFPNFMNLSNQEKATTEFCFWIAFAMEWEITCRLKDLADYPEAKRPKAIENMTFGEKVNLYTGLRPDLMREFKDFLDLVRKIRNDLFHGKKTVKKIKYKNMDIMSLEAKKNVIVDYYRVLRVNMQNIEATLSEADKQCVEKQIRKTVD